MAGCPIALRAGDPGSLRVFGCRLGGASPSAGSLARPRRGPHPLRRDVRATEPGGDVWGDRRGHRPAGTRLRDEPAPDRERGQTDRIGGSPTRPARIQLPRTLTLETVRKG